LALGFVKNSPSLFRDDYIKELVDRYITPHNYEEIKKSKTTFEFPALNLNSGKTEIISNRDEIEYEKYKLLMLASISIPGFSSAVKIGKEWYADAGFIDNTGLLYSLRKSRPEDIVIVLHNFPETHTPLDWDFKSWRKALWRATEIKQVTKSGELANLCSAMHQTQENLIKAIETAIPRKFLRGNKKIKQRLINAIKTQFSPDSIPAGGCPIVKKIIHIYPPADLSIFKTATPVFQDLKKAFNHMFWLATGKLREELAKI
jgi:predicted acylesterase/phospholipase RssA